MSNYLVMREQIVCISRKIMQLLTHSRTAYNSYLRSQLGAIQQVSR